MRKRRFIALIFIFAVIVSAIILFSLSLPQRFVVPNQQKNDIPVGEIYGEKNIGQTFVAAYDDLMALDVLMATYDRDITGELIFHLKSGIEAGDDLYQMRMDAWRIKNNRYFRFKIPEIEDSGGKTYYFYVEAPGARPGNAVTIWANDEDKYFEGEKILNEKAAEGDLVFKTVYDVGLRRKIGLFLGEITRAKLFPLNQKWFYWGLMGFLVMSCSLFLTFLVKVFIEKE